MDILFTGLTWGKWIAGWIAWFGFGLVPFAIAAAVIWLFPPLRKWALLAAVGWGLWFFGYTLGDTNGAARITAEWRAAELRAVQKGAEARQRAEQEVEREDSGVSNGVPRAGRLPNDRYDRDNP
jgi:hypothetical protein